MWAVLSLPIRQMFAESCSCRICVCYKYNTYRHTLFEEVLRISECNVCVSHVCEYVCRYVCINIVRTSLVVTYNEEVLFVFCALYVLFSCLGCLIRKTFILYRELIHRRTSLVANNFWGTFIYTHTHSYIATINIHTNNCVK